MKTVTPKEIISLVGIAVVTPLLALSMLVSARTVAVAESDVSLLALALCGAVISGVTGFGRRAIKVETTSSHSNRSRQSVISHS
jgi:hypothetical protein